MDGPTPTDRRQGGGERGKLGPRDSIPYHTANGPPVSNQRLPEILDGRHPLGESQLNTRRTHDTKAGAAEGRKRTAPGKVRPQAPGCLSCSGWGRHKMQAQPSLRICGIPENWNRMQHRTRSIYSIREPDSIDRGNSAPYSQQRDGISKPEQETTSTRLCQGGN